MIPVNNMRLNFYQMFTKQFIVYPGNTRIAYPVFALFEEVGEVVALYAKLLRGDYVEISSEKLCEELGDVVFNVAALASGFNFYLSEVLLVEDISIHDYYTKKLGNAYDLEVHTLLSMLAEDSSSIISYFLEEDFEKILPRLENIMTNVVLLGSCYHIKLELITRNNIIKLLDRKMTNNLMSNGSNR